MWLSIIFTLLMATPKSPSIYFKEVPMNNYIFVISSVFLNNVFVKSGL